MRKFEITALHSRTNQSNTEAKHPVFIAASLISPMLIYYYVNMIVVVLAAMFISGSSDLTEGPNSIIMQNNSLEIAMAVKILALLLAIAPLIPAFINEKPAVVSSNIRGIILTVLLGIALPIFANVVFYKAGITGADNSYARVQANQFSLPVWGGILLYGIVTPVCEEIVNRGIIYNRARKYAGVAASVIISALIFGLSHGNVAQFLYAFMLGCVIALIYEKEGAFMYPVLFHGVANSVVYIAMGVAPIKDLIVMNPVWIISGVFSLILLVLILTQKA